MKNRGHHWGHPGDRFPNKCFRAEWCCRGGSGRGTGAWLRRGGVSSAQFGAALGQRCKESQIDHRRLGDTGLYRQCVVDNADQTMVEVVGSAHKVSDIMSEISTASTD